MPSFAFRRLTRDLTPTQLASFTAFVQAIALDAVEDFDADRVADLRAAWIISERLQLRSTPED